VNRDPDPRTTTPEDGLVRRAVEGDPDAFARLYDLHVDGVYRFIFFRVGDGQVAEDVTSQVFLKAWEKLDGYQMRGLPFAAWLFRIARNLVIDYYRARRESVPLEAPEAIHVASDTDVDNNVAEKIELENLLALLHQLTDDQQQVLKLKFIDGLTTDEIAHQMGKRGGAVRALQMRGLQSLATLIERQ
jgi:RNA polymerase sigma-70 factor, ECF subfamily